MRSIAYDDIVSAVRSMCMSAGTDLPKDVRDAIRKAAVNETHPRARRILEQLIENAKIASDEKLPLCQDTGLTVVFAELGADIQIDCPDGKTITDAINEGVQRGYEEGLLRKSVVAEPLGERANTGTNCPAIIHTTIIAGDQLKITVMAKGGGCENKSQFKMFKPTADSEEIVDWVVSVVCQAGADACPPFVVGVGLGGDFELCCLLSKKVLLRPLDQPHANPYYGQLEKTILEKINASGIGPQGLGGDTTALAVLLETGPCHIASLPVAVNIECHAHRHQSVVL